jgi:hypothetical protein
MRITKITFLLALCGVFLCGLGVQYSFAGCVDRDTDLTNSAGCDNSQCDSSCDHGFSGSGGRPPLQGTLTGPPEIRPSFENLHARLAIAVLKFDGMQTIPFFKGMQSFQQEMSSPSGIRPKTLRAGGNE